MNLDKMTCFTLELCMHLLLNKPSFALRDARKDPADTAVTFETKNHDGSCLEIDVTFVDDHLHVDTFVISLPQCFASCLGSPRN